MEKYFLYPRKSTDVEDKQVLSIEAQITELRKYARDNNLQIVDTIIEKRSAKAPGRPKFNAMLERIKNGEANGIIAWMPDRLSRNPIDSGQIIYMLDQNVLTDLKFPYFWFQNTPQGKKALADEFNVSKQYTDNLSVNVKRGLRAKVRNGEFPGCAPYGYRNDKNTKTIVVDKKLAPVVVQAFEMYSRGDKTMGEIADFLYENGIKTQSIFREGKKTRGSQKIGDDKIKIMLSDVFYYGHFCYTGEIYEGKHKPLISKVLYDKVQTVIAGRGREQKQQSEPLPLCGLIRCGNCGAFVSGSHKWRVQKNGNRHDYYYYRCSHNKARVICREPQMRQDDLTGQLVKIAGEFAMPRNWGEFLLKQINDDELVKNKDSDLVVSQLRGESDEIKERLQRLLDSYLDGDVEQVDYRERRAEMMSRKKSLEEKIEQVLTGQNNWFEPARKFIKQMVHLCSISLDSDLADIKAAFSEIAGSNLFLQNKTLRASTQKSQGLNQKRLSEMGAESRFCLWQLWQITKQKLTEKPSKSVEISEMVAGVGFEPTTLWL